MYDSPALTPLGRSSADQFHRTAAFDTFPDEFGNVWYCMRKTLTSYDQDSCKWTFTADCDVHKPPPGSATSLRTLFLARDDPTWFLGLQALSCVSDARIDLEALRKVLAKYVLVLRGSLAAEFWHLKTTAGEMPPYRQAACFGCDTFSLHASCEQIHAAWLRRTAFSASPKAVHASQAHHRWARAQACLRDASHSAPCTSVRRFFCPAGFACSARVGASLLYPLLARQVNIATLASWDLPAMTAYFPDILGGAASRLLQACTQHAPDLESV